MMIVMAWSSVIQVRQSIRDLRVFLQKSYIQNTNNIKLPSPKGNLNVSEVSFQQGENGRKILDSISFSLTPGTICAVLGESGAGKSTLSRILVGYNSPSKGSVRLDSVSISNWNKKELCDNIGYLPQEIQLFGGEVVSNITRYKNPNEMNLKSV